MADDRAATHDKIIRAVRRGEVVDLRPPGETEPPPYDDEAAWPDRTVDGEWLAEVLTSRSSEIHHYGVGIIGARIDGGLDLEAADVPHRLALFGCQLGPHWLNLVEATLRLVDLRGTRCSGLSAPGAMVAKDLLLSDGFVATGEVNLVGATIGGALGFSGGTFANATGMAINANRCRVEGSVYMRHGFAAAGEVTFRGGASIGGNLECDGGTFDNPGGYALELNAVSIGGSVLLREGFSATGEVDLAVATIGGGVECDGTLTNPGGLALGAVGARVSRSVRLCSGLVASGEVSLGGAIVGGSIHCDGGRFTNPGGLALTMAGVRVADRVVLRRGFTSEGEVNLAGANVAGAFGCQGSTFSNPGGEAINADRARIGSIVTLRDCEIDGEVRFVVAVVESEVDCRRAVIRNPGGRTLRMDGAQVSGLLNLSHLQASGEIRLRRASIGGLLDCDNIQITNPDGIALDASWSRIGGYVRFGGDIRIAGLVSFRQAEAGGLADELAAWPERISVAGFHYNQLTGRSEDQAWRRRAQWLRKQDRPNPDAYVYLASVYRSVGDEHSARKILVERHDTLLHPPEHWRERMAERHNHGMAAAAWLRRWVLRLTIGHGYEPWRVLYLVVPIMLVMTLWFAQAKRDDLLVPTGSTDARASDCDSEYTCVQPAVLAVDTLVPLVDFGQRSRWTPDQSRDGGRSLAAATWFTSALGWVIASLVAASFTQVVRRE